MNTNAVISLAKICQYLAQEDIDKQKYFQGGSNDDKLPQHIYLVRKNVEWLYTVNPSSSTLTFTTNYLYAICGKYMLQANIINGNPGENVAVTLQSSGRQPIYIVVGRGDVYDPVEDDYSYINPTLGLTPTSQYVLLSSASGKPLVPGTDYTRILNGWTLNRPMNDTEQFVMIFNGNPANEVNSVGTYQFTPEETAMIRSIIYSNTTEATE